MLLHEIKSGWVCNVIGGYNSIKFEICNPSKHDVIVNYQSFLLETPMESRRVLFLIFHIFLLVSSVSTDLSVL